MASDETDLPYEVTTRHLHGVLGTEGAVSVTTQGSQASRDATIDDIIATIARLEAVFSAFDPVSDLARFRTGAPGPFAPELATVVELARSWQDRSQGAFNPHSGAITQLWLEAASHGRQPDDAELVELIADLDELTYDRSPHLNLNALAKGWIVDEAVRVAFASDPSLASVALNLGGDLIHRGVGSLAVAIEDPRTPWDNAPPLARITISEQAIASSGAWRRPLTIGTKRFSHVLDPRNGRPTEKVIGATVMADSAAEADVIATILCVLSEAERANFVLGLRPSTAWIVVPNEGSVATSENFSKRELPS